jgi:hypothetical protein
MLPTHASSRTLDLQHPEIKAALRKRLPFECKENNDKFYEKNAWVVFAKQIMLPFTLIPKWSSFIKKQVS